MKLHITAGMYKKYLETTGENEKSKLVKFATEKQGRIYATGDDFKYVDCVKVADFTSWVVSRIYH